MISVIIPVYMVEKYIRRCVESVLAQSYGDFEVILVDDGSPDKSGEICDGYAERDSRIRVVHKENGGLSDARNVGIGESKGEYLTFLDSDDYLHPKTLEILLEGIGRGAGISICGYRNVGDEEIEFEQISGAEPEILSGEQAVAKLLSCERINFIISCAKLYKRELFEKIRFPIGKLHEDEFVAHRLLFAAERVAFYREELYFYYVNPESITKKSYSLKRLDALDALYERYCFAREQIPKLEEASKRSYIGACLYHYQLISADKSLDKDKTERRKIRSRVKAEEKVISLYKGKNKLWISLFLICPPVCCKIRNAFKIGL